MHAIPTIIRRRTNDDPKLDLMRRVPLLADRARKELDLISTFTELVDVDAGKVLTREGDRGREFFVLVSGSAEVTRGGEHVATIAPGDFFGEIALVTKLPRTATVTAPVGSRVLVMLDAHFRRLVEIDPEIRLRILTSLGRRLEGLAAATAEAR
jgi:CRP-like cAMP-binding protein